MTRLFRGRTLEPALLLVLVGIAFANGLHGSFQFDDWNVIIDDSRVQSLAAWWHSMPGIRALLKLSYAINLELGAGPTGFRATNIVLHALNCMLLFAVLRRFGDRILPKNAAAAELAAATATVVFAVHPVQTESVTYISGRSNVLMALFALAAIYFWLRVGEQRGRGRLAWTVASLVALLLAAACKETALIAPLAMWLVWGALPKETRARAALPWPQTLLAVVASVVAIVLLPYGYLLDVSLATRGLFANFTAQSHAVWYLLGELINFGRLNADPAMPAVTSLTAGTVWRISILGAAFVYGLASLRRRPAVAFGILWFFVWLAPTNSIVARLDVVNDRQLYLAIAGPGWLLGLALGVLLRGRRRGWSTVAVISLAGLLAVGTMVRNRVYANEIAFWEDVVTKSPHNARAANNLGMAYALDCQKEAALRAFRQAENLDANAYRAAVNRALVETDDLPGLPARCKAQHGNK